MPEPAGDCGSGRSGCTNEPREPHTCPYAEEIHDDYETLCTCCESCTHDCVYDI